MSFFVIAWSPESVIKVEVKKKYWETHRRREHSLTSLLEIVHYYQITN